MRKFTRVINTLIITVCCAFFLTTCDFFNLKDLNKPEDGKGTIRLVIGNEDTSRTILPKKSEINFNSYKVVFTSTDGGADYEETITSASTTVTLAVGEYDLTVTAYNDSDDPLAEVTVDGIDIAAGTNSPISLTLEPIVAAGKSGTFSWNITLETGISGSMKITPLNGGTAENTTTLTTGGNSASSKSLISGNYKVVFNLTNPSKSIEWTEYLHIYHNLTSTYTQTFKNDYFFVYVTNVSLNESTLDLTVGEDDTLTATISPNTATLKATNQNVTWSFVSSPATGVISLSGTTGSSITVTAEGAGTATITVTAQDGSGKSDTCDVTVAAAAPTTYTVTFDENGGDTEADPKTRTTTAGGTVALPTTNPTLTGHTFVEWNTLANGTGTAFTAATTVNASITVYAKWTPNSYTVTFDENTGTTPANPTTKTVTYPATTVVTLPDPPTKTGSAFAGWNTEDDGSGTAFTATTPVTGNITVYAQWAPPGSVAITIDFDEFDDPAPEIDYFTISKTSTGFSNTQSLSVTVSGSPTITWTVKDGATVIGTPKTGASITLDAADYQIGTYTIIVEITPGSYGTSGSFRVAP